MSMFQNHRSQCITCGRIFIESDFSKSFCPYDKSGLVRLND